LGAKPLNSCLAENKLTGRQKLTYPSPDYGFTTKQTYVDIPMGISARLGHLGQFFSMSVKPAAKISSRLYHRCFGRRQTDSDTWTVAHSNDIQQSYITSLLHIQGRVSTEESWWKNSGFGYFFVHTPSCRRGYRDHFQGNFVRADFRTLQGSRQRKCSSTSDRVSLTTSPILLKHLCLNANTPVNIGPLSSSKGNHLHKCVPKTG
jgi:hypothetical protein